MRLLLDTHVLLWALADKKIDNNLRSLLLNKNNEVYYSVISPWEVEIKHFKYPEKFKLSADQLINLCSLASIDILNLQERHVKELKRIEQMNVKKHNDPFDRMLLAQALCDNLTFVTHDKKFSYYNDSHIMMV